ncbi:Type 1 glutamine amidotransferase-like domain-containing protein [Clostridium tagluense]|uniref:Type 1 glutamine amidotransferase-like domain-containing protein n=1 Tax=Clostridium tagluense TaxID=360422 RepID=UPI001CF495ED|nr:Type 1 glutamine amidotransferase-like domain-containing protein [Clostridium tagluense]MCB2313706.1 Type 1 glutamine amidotransferase-like domain-containing protein [Clostridium tagluense]MCB2318556.1 Type 1 glutamine amidotransferase-like domain-containing protein [Clostridium tagluense]MCB2323368.1 Type 1 glutamine amidotransferase-like domain-containing protein [Clostridium tagluense]MCB2328339.1 Type 1 glutamine amidotransferase-like domain-containing protein [Clostridium tagluense]MCB
MKTHYYFGWFNDVFVEKLVRLLHEDITDRKSLVMISANPFLHEDEEVGATERSWLDQANIMFDEYHLIDYGVQKEEAQKLIQNASVIFLLGGDTIEQNSLLIKKSRAVVMGTSAGAINMSAKWLCSEYTGYKGEISSIYDGIGLDDFSALSHFDLENNIAKIQGELSPLTEEMNVYASNKDCAVRVKGDKIDILGNVYLISHSKIQKLDETL